MKAGLNGRFPAAEIIFVGKRAWRRREKKENRSYPAKKISFPPIIFCRKRKTKRRYNPAFPPLFPRRQNKGFSASFSLSFSKSLSFPSLRNVFLDREYCTTIREESFSRIRGRSNIFQKSCEYEGRRGMGKFTSLVEPVKLFRRREQSASRYKIERGRGPDCLEPSKTLPNPTQRFPDTFHFPPLGAHPKQHPLLLL